MNLDRPPADIASAAADQLRALNHALLNAKDVPAPEISATVQALITLTSRMPQALLHLTAHLGRQQKAERVRLDNGADPAAAVIQADTYLTDAETDLADVSAHLRKAGALLFTMGAPWELIDEDREESK